MKFLVILCFCASAALALPRIVQNDLAPICDTNKCQASDNCRCSSQSSPLKSGTAPQLISLTINEAVVKDTYDAYWQPLLADLVNPDGAPSQITFFVAHDYTDYQLVNSLYMDGHEIAVQSITDSNQTYWRTASLETLVEEFAGAKEIISTFANIPIEDINGVRTPQLAMQGNRTIEAYVQSGLSYDSSWPTLPDKPLYPYTLDYKSDQQCLVAVACPNEEYKGFWVLPIVDLNGGDKECNSLANCGINGTVDIIANWLVGEVDKVRGSTRVPLTIMINSYWFSRDKDAFAGLKKALKTLQERPDTFLVSQAQVLDWVKNPVPLEEFETAPNDRLVPCIKKSCPVMKGDDPRYFNICVSCPEVYPWLGNPQGKK